MHGATHNIKGRAGNGNIKRCLDLHRKGKSKHEIAAILGIAYRTVASYIERGTPQFSLVSRDKTPRCRCHLRLSTPEELAQGHCSDCLPTSAVAYLGKRGDTDACASGLRPYRGE